MRRGLISLASLFALAAASPVRAQGLAWSVPLSTGTPSAASSDLAYNQTDPTVFITQGNKLFAFNATLAGNGAARWAPFAAANTIQNFPSPVQLKSGQRAIFLGDMSGFLYAVNYETRQQLWAPVDLRHNGCSGDQIMATPTVQLRAFANTAYQAAPLVGNDDLVMVITRYGCADGNTANRVYGIHGSDGSVAWTFNATATYAMSFGSEGCAIDYVNNLIYCGTDQPPGGVQPTLWAISTLDGSVKWKRNAGAIRARPAMRGSKLYVGTYAGILSARNQADGTEAWSYAVTSTANIVRNVWPEWRPGAPNAIFVTDTSNKLVRVDEGTTPAGTLGGNLVWADPNVSTIGALDPDGYLYVGTTGGAFTQLYMGDGKTTNSAAFGTTALFDPALDIEGGAGLVNRVFIANSSSLALFSVPWPGDGTQHTTHPPPATFCQSNPAGTACSDGLDCSCDSSVAVNGACPPGPNNDVCREGTCVANIFYNCVCNNVGDNACCPGTECCGSSHGGCAIIASSAQNCGGCGIACPAGYYCSNGDCVYNGCTPNCSGKTCGSDGCGGTCGACCGRQPDCNASGQCVCNSSSCPGGVCVNGSCCYPNCSGKTCGSDGCGGSCGTCSGATPSCDGTGKCVCTAASCSGSTPVCDLTPSDSYYGKCICSSTSCPSGQYCAYNEFCCTPNCSGKLCGPDGCGGSCGTCAGTTPWCYVGVTNTCGCNYNGQCPAQYPVCSGYVAGSQNGTCVCTSTSCGAGSVCYNGSCCTPNCSGKSCGSDGCGGSCGTCSGSLNTCNSSGVCVCSGASCGAGSVCLSSGSCCTPNCTGKSCGSDGCGGSCGTCSSTTPVCSSTGVCQCTSTSCSSLNNGVDTYNYKCDSTLQCSCNPYCGCVDGTYSGIVYDGCGSTCPLTCPTFCGDPSTPGC